MILKGGSSDDGHLGLRDPTTQEACELLGLQRGWCVFEPLDPRWACPNQGAVAKAAPSRDCWGVGRGWTISGPLMGSAAWGFHHRPQAQGAWQATPECAVASITGRLGGCHQQ